MTVIIHPPILLRACENCRKPIPDRRYQNPATVRACCPECAGIIFKLENPDWSHVKTEDLGGNT